MNFKEYMSNAWSIHATDPKKVADEFKQNFHLMESEDDVSEISGLIVHVCGEHLGEWTRGIELLRKLKNNATINNPSAMNRYMGILNLGNNPNTSIDNFSPSDQARIYASTASALAKLGGLRVAEKFLKLADDIVDSQVTKEDDVLIAITKSSERVATTLQMKAEKNENEVDFMNYAISLGKKYSK